MGEVVIGHFELFELILLFLAKMWSVMPENKFLKHLWCIIIIVNTKRNQKHTYHNQNSCWDDNMWFLPKNHRFQSKTYPFSGQVPQLQEDWYLSVFNIFLSELKENDRMSMKFMGKLTDLKNIAASLRNLKIKKNCNRFCGIPVRT